MKFFNKHAELVLVGLAVILVAILGVYYFWGVGSLVANLNKAVNIGGGKNPQIGFDLSSAASLNLKEVTH
jgi:hypothetical protein